MRHALTAAPLLVLALHLGTPPAASQPRPDRVPADCDRACLEELIDRYLEAVVANDPAGLPLSADVKYTETEQILEVGDGFWNTATGRGRYGHAFADPETGQVAWMGAMEEAGGPLLMALRLRVQLGLITEIETSYFRAGGGGPNDIAGMAGKDGPEPLWLEPIPAEERLSRADLIAVADAYFEGIEDNDGRGVYPMADDCDRTENGARTTNAPSGAATPGGFDYMSLSCKAQLESGYLAIVTNVHSRRYPLVDEERGVVWANAVFDLGGTVSEITLTTGETVSMGPFAGRASSIHVAEAFRIENGLIRRIEMIGPSVPYHLNAAWPEGGED